MSNLNLAEMAWRESGGGCQRGCKQLARCRGVLGAARVGLWVGLWAGLWAGPWARGRRRGVRAGRQRRSRHYNNLFNETTQLYDYTTNIVHYSAILYYYAIYCCIRMCMPEYTTYSTVD